jgi:hypothetical protein
VHKRGRRGREERLELAGGFEDCVGRWVACPSVTCPCKGSEVPRQVANDAREGSPALENTHGHALDGGANRRSRGSADGSGWRGIHGGATCRLGGESHAYGSGQVGGLGRQVRLIKERN